MRKSIAGALFVATAVIAACSESHAENGGPSATKTYQVGNFQQIEVAGPYEVNVRTGANASVAGTGPEKMLEHTVVEVRGDKLVIRPLERKNWLGGGWSHKGTAQFTVTVPQLRAATIAGSGDIQVDRVQGPSFEGTVAGSGGISLAQIDVQQLKLAIAGSGGVRGGGGKVQTAEYDIAGSGDLDLGAVVVQDLKVSIAGSGGVHANAKRSADVSIMGSGDVEIAGGAKCNVSKMGSGDVRCS
jgi:hypothetical protein